MTSTLLKGQNIFIAVATYGNGRKGYSVHDTLARARGYAKESVGFYTRRGVEVNVEIATCLVVKVANISNLDSETMADSGKEAR